MLLERIHKKALGQGIQAASDLRKLLDNRDLVAQLGKELRNVQGNRTAPGETDGFPGPLAFLRQVEQEAV